MNGELIGRAVEIRSQNGIAYRGIVNAVRPAGELGELFELVLAPDKTEKRLVHVTDRGSQIRIYRVTLFNRLIAHLRERGHEPASGIGHASCRFANSGNGCDVDVRLSGDDEVTVVCLHRNRVERQVLCRGEDIERIAATIVCALTG